MTTRTAMAAHCESVRAAYDPEDARRLALGRSAYEYRHVDEKALLRIEYGGQLPPWDRPTEGEKARTSEQNAAYWRKHGRAITERRRNARRAWLEARSSEPQARGQGSLTHMGAPPLPRAEVGDSPPPPKGGVPA